MLISGNNTWIDFFIQLLFNKLFIWHRQSHRKKLVQYSTICTSHNKINEKRTYSATTVFPADVCAETNTDCKLSMHIMASFWKGSRIKLYCFAGSDVSGINGTYSWLGGNATSCVHPSCVSKVCITILEPKISKLKNSKNNIVN